MIGSAKKIRTLMISAIMFMLFACSASALPLDGNCNILPSKQNVPLDKSWNIQFNKNVIKSSINENSIQILDANDNTVKVTLSIDAQNPKIVIVKPVDKYEQDKKYQIWIRDDVMGDNGKRLKQPVVMEFVTESLTPGGGDKPGEETKPGTKLGTANAKVEVAQMFPPLKAISIKSTTIKGAAKYKLGDSGKLVDIGTTIPIIINEDSIKVYVYDASGYMLGNGQINVKDSVENLTFDVMK